MDATLVIWIIVLAALLVIDWRRKWSAVRILVVLMALFQLWFFHPMPYRAARELVALPHDQRVTTWGGHDSLRVDDYTSGILTMARAAQRQIDRGSLDRIIAVSVLVWLAVSPIIPRRRSRSSPKPNAGFDAPAA